MLASTKRDNGILSSGGWKLDTLVVGLAGVLKVQGLMPPRCSMFDTPGVPHAHQLSSRLGAEEVHTAYAGCPVHLLFLLQLGRGSRSTHTCAYEHIAHGNHACMQARLVAMLKDQEAANSLPRTHTHQDGVHGKGSSPGH